MLTALHILLGALGGGAFVLAARALGRRRELPIYAAGLVAAALIYVVFALAGGAPGAWLAVEFAGLVVFTLFALPGLKSSTMPPGIGWAAHALWDLLLHADAVVHAGAGANAHFVPDWYRLICAGFDFALAAYLIALSRRPAAPAEPR
ncbi:MAG TPA: DUF6010 family protein [Pyrinomonadaceae bacterium]|nr:DUF6010 family protein [Pyrinomonadaceae bacterium]